MPNICYTDKRFSPGSLDIIQQANDIIEEYIDQGFQLTLRQLYYQFVARAIIANKQTEYKRLASIISDARLAGRIDWKAIVDRTRNMQQNSHWDSPSDIINACANSYQIDKWHGQPNRVEVWIEKDALIGVIENVCQRNDVAYFSCRGYTSQSEMWSASQRLIEYETEFGQETYILHLGDHDPSGIDMTRDIQDRLRLFNAETVVNRIALNMDQIKQYNPPTESS